MDKFYLNILIGIVFFILGLIVKSFLPSYMKKKGENLATKEDIAKITENVENVKSYFEINTISIIDYENARRKVLIKFYDQLTTFHYEFLAINFGDFPSDNGKALFEFQKGFNECITKIAKSYQRVVIYVAIEEELFTYANNLIEYTLSIRKIFKKKFPDVKRSMIDEHFAFLNKDNENSQVNEAVDKANEANKAYWDEMKPVINKYQNEYRYFLTELNSILKFKR